MLLTRARIVTMNSNVAASGADDSGAEDLSAVLIEHGTIVWVGSADEAPSDPDTYDLGGRLLTPGLIDCHTHIVHGGNRAREFAERLEGVPYEEIARRGGGIVSTVEATRGASVDALVAMALPRLDALIAEGVTTIEVKSGYGLEREAELRMLRAARMLETVRPIRDRDVLSRCPCGAG